MNVTYHLVSAPDQQKPQGNAASLHLLSECTLHCCNDLLLASHFASSAFQCELNIHDSLGVSRLSSWNPECPELGNHYVLCLSSIQMALARLPGHCKY